MLTTSENAHLVAFWLPSTPLKPPSQMECCRSFTVDDDHWSWFAVAETSLLQNVSVSRMNVITTVSIVHYKSSPEPDNKRNIRKNQEQSLTNLSQVLSIDTYEPA